MLRVSQPENGRVGSEVNPSALATVPLISRLLLGTPAVPPTQPGKPPPMALHLNVLGSRWRSCMWARAVGPAQAPAPTLAFTVGIHCSSQRTRQSHWNWFPRRSLGQEAGEGLRPGFHPLEATLPTPSPGEGSGWGPTSGVKICKYYRSCTHCGHRYPLPSQIIPSIPTHPAP